MSKKTSTSPPTSPARAQAPPARQGGLFVDGKRVESETTRNTHAEIEAERHAERVKERAARRPGPMPAVETKVEQRKPDAQPEVSDAESNPD